MRYNSIVTVTVKNSPDTEHHHFITELKVHVSAAASRKGHIVLVVGPGVSRHVSGSELATWTGLLVDGVQRCVDAGYVDESWAEFQRFILHKGGTRERSAVAANIEEVFRRRGEGTFKEWLDVTVGSLAVADGRLVEAIARLGCPVVTTTYDNLIEAVTGRDYCVWDQFEESRKVLVGESSKILHIYGHYCNPHSIMFGGAGHVQLHHTESFRRLAESIRSTARMVFIGCEEIADGPHLGTLRSWAREALQGRGANFSYWLVPKAAEEKLRTIYFEDGDQARLLPYEDYDGLLAMLDVMAPARSTGVADATAIVSERPRVKIVKPLSDWVNDRWGLRASSDVFPSWNELCEGTIQLPATESAKTKDLLMRERQALLVGRSGSGKSVFAVALGQKLQTSQGLQAYMVDLSEFSDNLSAFLATDIDILCTIDAPVLLIVDNVHNGHVIANYILDRTRGARSNVRVLFVSRLREVSEWSPLLDITGRLAAAVVRLEPDEAMFKRVSQRITTRHGRQGWRNRDHGVWLETFGGDLMAFGQAVLYALTKRRAEPTWEGAARYIRSIYLDPLSKVPGGKEALLRLAALSSLEIGSIESILGEALGLFLNAARDGRISSYEMYGIRHWRVPHPGSANLVLRVAAAEAKLPLALVRADHLSECCRRHPCILPIVHDRMTRRQYVSGEDRNHWVAYLRSRPELVENALIEYPRRVLQGQIHGLPVTLRLEDQSFRQQLSNALRITPRIRLYRTLTGMARDDARPIARLILTNRELYERFWPKNVMKFLEILGGNEAKSILVDMLERGYGAVVRRAKLASIVAFLRYVTPAQARVVIREILADDGSRERIFEARTGLIVDFLRLLEPREVYALLDSLLTNEEFVFRNAMSDLGGLLGFLRIVEDEFGKADATARSCGTFVGALAGGNRQPCDARELLLKLPEMSKFIGRHAAVAAIRCLASNDEPWFGALFEAPPRIALAFLSHAPKHEAEALFGRLLCDEYVSGFFSGLRDIKELIPVLWFARELGSVYIERIGALLSTRKSDFQRFSPARLVGLEETLRETGVRLADDVWAAMQW